jgi:hypothetical protein
MVDHQGPCYKVFSTFVVNYFVTTLTWVHNQLLGWAIKRHFLYEKKLKVSKLELKLGMNAKECKHTPISKETTSKTPKLNYHFESCKFGACQTFGSSFDLRRSNSNFDLNCVFFKLLKRS